MVKRYWVVFGAIVIFLLGWGVTARPAWFYSTNYPALYSTQQLQLSHSSRVMQSFLARYPGLYRIEIHFSNHGKNTGRLVFRLKESCSANADLVTQVVPEASIADNAEFAFEFPPLDQSAFREYCLVLEQLPDQPLDELAVYASSTNLYPDGATIFDAAPPPAHPAERVPPAASPPVKPRYFVYLPAIFNSHGSKDRHGYDIGFNIYYAGPLLPTLQALMINLARHKTFLFGQPWFYLAIFALYLIGLIFLLHYVWRRGVNR